jgi:hypothetical protein
MANQSKKIQTITKDTSKQLRTVNLYGVEFLVTYHPEHDDYIIRRNDGSYERNFSIYSIEDEMRDCNPLTKWQVVDRLQSASATKPRKDPFSQSAEEFEANWQAQRDYENAELERLYDEKIAREEREHNEALDREEEERNQDKTNPHYQDEIGTNGDDHLSDAELERLAYPNQPGIYPQSIPVSVQERDYLMSKMPIHISMDGSNRIILVYSHTERNQVFKHLDTFADKGGN